MCISHIAEQTQENTERIHPLAMAPWHDTDPHNQECICTFLPPNQQGESVKDIWTDDHIEFIVENKENPNFLAVYADGSLTKNNGR